MTDDLPADLPAPDAPQTDAPADASVEARMDAAAEALRRVYGYHAFRPAQEPVLRHLFAGFDALAVMPTGGGKSVLYQIPALVLEGTVIVVSPLIALMQDQVEALKQLGVRAALLNSTLTAREQREVEKRFESGALDLLYVAPERLLTDGFMDRLARAHVALFAIDEAHCISQWGHDFRPEYRMLGEVRRRLAHVPCLAVTATADAPTQRDVLAQLGMDDDALFVTGFDRPNIRYRVDVSNEPKRQLLTFLDGHRGEAGIVYCLSRASVEKAAAMLCAEGVDALPYHAGLPQNVREANQTRFLREEGVVMCATIAFGMGIDKPNVRFVVHMDVPKSVEAYYQETGRAGRDGEPSEAYLLYSMASVVQQRRMMDDGGDAAHAWVGRHKLDAIVGFCETARCRRAVLLGYFGQNPPEYCGNCDTCITPLETWDATVAAQKLMSAVHRTGQRFGGAHVVSVVRGESTEKVTKYGHDRLPTFGVGADLEATEWRSVLRQLVAAGYLAIEADNYGRLVLTERATPVLRGQETVELRRDPTPAPKARRSRASAAPPIETTTEGERRFQLLRTLRLELARDQAVPPYVIFSDKTLREMAERAPTTEAGLREISGVGEAKMQRYGEAFLTALLNAG